MIAPVPLRGINRSLYSNSTTGIRKAKVFPEPVFAEASKSLKCSANDHRINIEEDLYRPSSNGPKFFLELRSYFVNFISLIALSVSSETPRSLSDSKVREVKLPPDGIIEPKKSR